MTEQQIRKQIETIRKFTQEALQSKEVAQGILNDPKIFPPQKPTAKKKPECRIINPQM